MVLPGIYYPAGRFIARELTGYGRTVYLFRKQFIT